MHRRFLLVAPVPLLAAAFMVTTPPAAGAAVTHGVFRAAPGSTSLEHSSNWSGVAVTGGSYQRVTGSWVVPRVKITPGNRYAADWVGIGGYGSSDLIQAGTSEESVGGHANYYAWTEILPAPSSQLSGFAVSPGNSITVDVNQVSAGSWTITVTNHSTGKVATKNFNYVSTHSSAEWIHEAPTVGGTQARLATTTKANFDGGTVNGSTPIGSAGTLHEIQLVGPTDATPSGLDSDQNGFAVADGSAVPSPPPS